MANYQAIVRNRPEVRDFIRNRRWVHRGEAVVYGPNTHCDSFSTDAAGFRHSTFRGETLAVRDILQRQRYGLVFGSSHLYGFGLAGNENTVPSLLADRFGFPFANVCMPEASSRNLFSLLVAMINRSERPPAAVILMTGGDFTAFCFTGIADSVFGSPNLKQIAPALKERGGRAPAEAQFPGFLAFTSLWTRSFAQLCGARGLPFLLGNDTTFFEKSQPSEIEIECGLGVGTAPAQEDQFATHRSFVGAFYARRQALADALGVPLAGPGASNDLGFIDEFHYDREGVRAFSDDLAGALASML